MLAARAPSPSARDRRRGDHDGVGRGVRRAGHRGVAGLFENPYAGLVVFVAFPALFVLGLLLIPLGMWLQRRKLRRDPGRHVDWPVLDFRARRVRRTTLSSPR